MTLSIRQLFLMTAALLAAPRAWAQGQGDREWVATDIFLIAGVTVSNAQANAVSDTGQVVGGYSTPDGLSHAFSWTPNGGLVDLSRPGASNPGYAIGVNNAGQVVGPGYVWSQTTGMRSLVFVWCCSGIDRETLSPYDINNAGEIVGICSTPVAGPSPCTWTTATQALPEWFFIFEGTPKAVNDAGQVVGSGFDGAFLWTRSGGTVNLGTLGGRLSGASGVSENGEVVGSSLLNDTTYHAFSWTGAGGMVDLGTLGGTNSAATGINDAGLVVGTSDTTDNTASHAFARPRGGSMVDLGTLGGTRSEATAVSNAGEVVGWALNAADERRAVIWSGPWKDLAVNFGPGLGVWALRQTSWMQVHSVSPESMITGDLDGNRLDDLVFDFGSQGVWVWMNHATWLWLNPQNPTHLVTGDFDNNGRDEVVLDIPDAGLWVWRNNTSWEFLHPVNARHLAVGNLDGLLGDELIVNFQGGHGVWTLVNDTTWERLHGLDVTTMVTADLDADGKAELIANFPTFGVWAFRNFANWSQVHPFEALRIEAAHIDAGTQIDLVFDFGPGWGLWTYDNDADWSQLHGLSSQGMAAGDFDGDGKDDLVVGFGGAGLWRYAKGAWWPLHGVGPGGFATGRLH